MRKKWANVWDSIVYCSSTCRRPLGALDLAFEAGILNLLTARRTAAFGIRKWELEFTTCEEAEEIVLKEWAEKPVVLNERRGSQQEDERRGGGAGREDEEEEDSDNEAGEISIDRQRSSSPTLSIATTTTTQTSVSTNRSDPLHTRERCRKAARRLTEEKIIAIWQHGKIVDPSFAKGTLELRGVEGHAVSLIEVRRKMVERAERANSQSDEEEGGKGKKGKGGKGSKGRKSYDKEIEAFDSDDGGKKGKGKKGKR